MITAVIALVISAALVAAAVRFALRPLDSMAALAKTVSQGNRGYRLAPTRTDTELGQTAQAFDEMLDELEGAETRARQAEERTRAFLADAAHELRTPIAGVQAAAETLLHHDDQLDHDERQHLQALLVREAERAGALISDLLTAARLDAGIDLDLAPVSLRTLAISEIDRVRLLHPETVVTMSGPEVVARADAARVSGILRNVIDNAVRAAGPQGKVHLVVREHDQFAIAEIWDSGPGCRRRSANGSSSGWYDLIMVGQEMPAARVSGWRSPGLRPGTRRGSQLRGSTRQRRDVPAGAATGTARGDPPLAIPLPHPDATPRHVLDLGIGCR